MEPIRDFLGQPAPAELQPLLRVLDCTDVMELAGMYGEARERGDEKLKTAINDRVAKLIGSLGKPLPVDRVIAAIYAVGAEASRRGEMYPQTSDEQRDDRHAVTRVVEMLQWYEQNTGCAKLRGWPGA